MKEYMVRMIDTAFDNAIVDGDVFKCDTPETALFAYKARCKRLGIAILDWYIFEVKSI